MFEIIKSKKSAIKKGKHFILQTINQDNILSKRKTIKALKFAYDFAEKNSKNQRYRIAINGKGERHNNHFHIHIILPEDNDKLIRIIQPYE